MTRPTTTMQPTHTNQQLLFSHSHITMLFPILLCSKETSTCWNIDNKDSFQKKAEAGIIDIDNTTLAYIESIRVKFWGGKKVETLHTNFWTTAADLRVERETKGQRAGKSYLCIGMQPYLTISPVVLSDVLHAQLLPPPPPMTTAETTKMTMKTTTAMTTTMTTPMTMMTTTTTMTTMMTTMATTKSSPPCLALPAMSSKKTTPSSAAAAKSGNVLDDLSARFQKTGVSLPKKAAFTTYSTKVTDPILICTFLEGGKFFVKVDMNIAAALTCGDRIKATLTPDGMGTSFQRGVYVSFFGSRHLQKDLGNAYSLDSSCLSA
jgi:hypothetical protein